MTPDHAARHVSQRERVYRLLSDLRWHSHAELAAVGGNRYTARVLELKRLGFVVESRHEQEGADGKRYRLVSLTPGTAQAKRVKVLLDEDCALELLGGAISGRTREAVRTALESFDANRGKL